MAVNCRFALALHLIQVIGDTVDFAGCVLDGGGRALGRFGRFGCSVQRLGRGLFGARGGFLSLRGRSLGLGSLLLARRRASGHSDRKDQNRQYGRPAAHRRHRLARSECLDGARVRLGRTVGANRQDADV